MDLTRDEKWKLRKDGWRVSRRKARRPRRIPRGQILRVEKFEDKDQIWQSEKVDIWVDDPKEVPVMDVVGMR